MVKLDTDTPEIQFNTELFFSARHYQGLGGGVMRIIFKAGFSAFLSHHLTVLRPVNIGRAVALMHMCACLVNN